MAEEITVSSRAEWMEAVRRAKPGTTILIAPGVYEGGMHCDGLSGTAAEPIVMAGADPRQPPEIRGGSTGLQLTDPVHVELRDMVITQARGNGLNIDDGGSYDTPAQHVRLRNITVRDVGPTGNRDGIKLSGLDHFEIVDCVVQRWGDGGSAIDMVGCHAGRIRGCTFRFRDDVAANGVQTKGGSSAIEIQSCRFEHAGNRAVNIGGSTGRAFFRPADPGYEAKDITVQDNLFIGSLSPVAFVGVDGAVVRYNTIYRPARWVLRILQESQGDLYVPCRNGQFANNVIVFRAAEVSSIVNVGPGTAPETFRFHGNVWYCADQPERSHRLALPTPEVRGTFGVDPQLRDPEQGDLRLGPQSPIRDAGARPVPVGR
jgi:hypothetical protein